MSEHPPNPDGVEAVGFTTDQLRDIRAIAAAESGTPETVHNRWYWQMVADEWHFGNTNDAAQTSSYCRMFHTLTPEQQILVAHELSDLLETME